MVSKLQIMKENTPELTKTTRLICAYQLAIWQRDRLTICLKCRPTAWTGRSSRRGSNLGGGERNLDIASIISMKTEECADCHPRLLDLIIRLKINRLVCVGGGWMWPSMRAAVSSIAVIQEGKPDSQHHAKTSITSHIHFICMYQTGDLRQRVHLCLFNCVHLSLCYVLVCSTEEKESRKHHVKLPHFQMMEAQLDQLTVSFSSSAATLGALDFILEDNVMSKL